MSRNIPDSSKKLLQYIKESITLDESEEEVISLSYYIIEHLFDLNKNEIILDRSINISSSELKALHKFLERINDHEPIQYIIGEADFYDRKFVVNPSVLIPRPETEELVHLIISEYKGKKPKFADVGTGSGCIPVTLAKELNGAKAYAIDFDPRVIRTAKQNSERHGVQVNFMLIDVLRETFPLQSLDFVVSNPPYVTYADRELMKANVTHHEPATALYVKDEDPLLFYRRIAEISAQSLKPEGKIYFEVNEKYADDVKSLLEVMDFEECQVVRDLNGKDRIVHARLSNEAFT